MQEACWALGALVNAYALFMHLRRHRRVSGGVVLAAAMLTLQAIVHPSVEQVIAQQYEMEEDESADEEIPSLPKQIRQHAERAEGPSTLLVKGASE